MAPEAEKQAAKPKAKVGVKPAVKLSSRTTVAQDSSGAARPQNDIKGKVKVTQLIGTIARKWDQEATLIGLGLGKRHRSRVLEDTPSVRGMIYKVRHLVRVTAEPSS